jgi:hypothetical protein
MLSASVCNNKNNNIIIHYTKIDLKHAVCFNATEKTIQNECSENLKGCVVFLSNVFANVFPEGDQIG